MVWVFAILNPVFNDSGLNYLLKNGFYEAIF